MEGFNHYSGGDPITVPMKDTSSASSVGHIDGDDEQTQIVETETFTRGRRDDVPSLTSDKEETEDGLMPMQFQAGSSSFVLESQKDSVSSVPAQKDLIDCPSDLYLSSSIIYRYKTASLNLKLPTGWREKNGITYSTVLNACLYPKVYCMDDLEDELECPRCGRIIAVRDEKEVPIMKMVDGRELFSVMIRTMCTSSKEHLPGKRLVIGIDIPGCKRCFSHPFNIQSRYRPKKPKYSLCPREKLTVFQANVKSPKEQTPKRRRYEYKPKPKSKSFFPESPQQVNKSAQFSRGRPKMKHEVPVVFNPSSSSSSSPSPSSSPSSSSSSNQSSSFVEAEGKVEYPIAERKVPEIQYEATDDTEQDTNAVPDEFRDPIGNIKTPIAGKVQSANPRQRTIAFGVAGSDSVPILPFSLVSPSTSFVVGTNPAVIQYLNSKLTEPDMEDLLNGFQEYMVSNGFCKEDGIMFFKTNQSSKYIIISYSDKSFITHLENYLRNRAPGTQNTFQKDLLESHIITFLGNFVLGSDAEHAFSDEPFSSDMPAFSSRFVDWYQRDN